MGRRFSPGSMARRPETSALPLYGHDALPGENSGPSRARPGDVHAQVKPMVIGHDCLRLYLDHGNGRVAR
jgi:hypothetical protein